MASVKKVGGRYLVCTRTGRKRTMFKTWFRVVGWNSNAQGFLLTPSIYCPKELFGKKLRLVVEVMEDDEVG